jgi:hypothetical protein
MPPARGLAQTNSAIPSSRNGSAQIVITGRCSLA